MEAVEIPKGDDRPQGDVHEHKEAGKRRREHVRRASVWVLEDVCDDKKSKKDDDDDDEDGYDNDFECSTNISETDGPSALCAVGRGFL